MADQEEEVSVPEKKYDVRILICFVSNERRTVIFKDQTAEEAQKIIGTVNSAFNVIRTNDSLMLSGTDGAVVVVYLDNVTLIEVHLD